ncbi:isochorismatase family protein [Rhodococcus sp. X156]|uniref:isochorismatase family protein n=1 Tax=Rhodococcus sp. X156 TaxID=2499145 RepID=UPI000FDB82E5|nr:isochorismatase family protein [Rhodococcus sp. X156]
MTTDTTDTPSEATTVVRACLVVDCQPTFCEDGELPVAGGNDVCTRGAAFLAAHDGDYDLVMTSQDYHVDPGDHFSATPDFVDSWPPHGVAGTPNAELHPALANARIDVRILKGQHEAAYSLFDGATTDGTAAVDVLRAAGVTDVDVFGIAESHCVFATVLAALRHGFRVRVLSDLTVPVTFEMGHAARHTMLGAGATYLPSTAAFPVPA